MAGKGSRSVMTRIKLDEIGQIRKTRIGNCEVQDMSIKFYNSGKYFVQYLYKDLLQLLAKDMHDNVAAHYDNIVMIEGGEGSGKSNLAWNLIEHYSPGFDIGQTYVYNMDGIRDRFKNADYGGGLFWMDETSQIASNRTWQSEDNKDLVAEFGIKQAPTLIHISGGKVEKIVNASNIKAFCEKAATVK